MLVVEDHDDTREVLLMMLEAFGAAVRGAKDGADALRAIAQHRPDLMFCDLVMPGLDGFELLRRVRGDPDLRGMRVVAMTGWLRDEGARRRSGEAGFDGYLVKPIDPEILGSKLQRILGTPP